VCWIRVWINQKRRLFSAVFAVIAEVLAGREKNKNRILYIYSWHIPRAAVKRVLDKRRDRSGAKPVVCCFLAEIFSRSE
jgi:hypothetical protein